MNLLADSISPYLLQHKDNPVHWRPWNAAALAEARRDNKPILLSVGYASCHWCHVMAHESFENSQIAAVMNEHFVNIKVDREERPDIDAIYMRALQLTGGQGGWPLTMFLNPNAEPFWGGTYFPPQSKFGRHGFMDVLHTIARLFREEPAKIRAATDAMRKGLQELVKPTPPTNFAPQDIPAHTRRFLPLTDAEHGGIPAGAPKFPQTQALELLWRAWRRDGDSACRDAVHNALEAMCQGGMYDHLGGGFYRYSTDRQWLVPHFEKMLYDNAMLLSLLTCVWQGTEDAQRRALYRQRIEESIDWMLREMRLPAGGEPCSRPVPEARSGAFAASLDADSPGGEGCFYVWREAEIDEILGADSAAFKTAYDVSPEGNWEGACILNRRLPKMRQGGKETPDEAKLAASRGRLLAQREKRPRPGLDDKILADWNGLAIAALVRAGAALQRPDWIRAALAAFAFISDAMGDGDRLFHIHRGRRGNESFSSDYANMIHAALILHRLHGGQAFLERALGWIATLDREYADSAEWYFDTARADGEEALILRLRSSEDGAQPCANFVMAEVFATLFHLTGEPEWRQRCENLLAAEAGGFDNRLFSLAGLLNAADHLHNKTLP